MKVVVLFLAAGLLLPVSASAQFLSPTSPSPQFFRDGTPPTVSLTSPLAGAVVSGTVTLAAAAKDNVRVYGVQFYVDNVAVGVEDLTAPYAVAWNSTKVANGLHTIKARARDTSNNIATASVSVTVQNAVTAPCTLALTATVPGSATTGVSVAFSATAAATNCTGSPSYSWQFGDGASATGQTSSHTYGVVGSYAWKVSASVGGTSATTGGTIAVAAPTWTLVWSDEFDGSVLDRTKWGTIYPFNSLSPPDPTQELEWYVDDDAHHVVSNGTLKLIATQGSTQPGFQYTSGLIHSYPALVQMYGRFEARLKIPAGQGLWPAFWLMPAPIMWPPEIDVMENLGQDPRTIYFTHHWSPNYPNGGGNVQAGQEGSSIQTTDLSAGFHVYAIEWSPTSLVWFLDGVKVWQASTHLPIGGYNWTGMYVILNLAVGAPGSWPGAPNASTPFPATLEVDHVRVYAHQ